MTYHELCELADQEIRLGQHDRALMERALKEARGVTSHAHQLYWQLRAAAIQREAKRFPAGGDEHYFRELRARLAAEGRRRRLRANIVGWSWVVACVAGLVGAFIFFRAARATFDRGGVGFYGFAVSGVVCLIIAVAGYVVAKRDADQDPFSDW